MGTKLYVGGVPYSVTGDRLQEIFSAHGSVESANVISDKFSGQSRGFGFVEMSSQRSTKSDRVVERHSARRTHADGQ
jgi:RNA recognition motif-containing protein